MGSRTEMPGKRRHTAMTVCNGPTFTSTRQTLYVINTIIITILLLLLLPTPSTACPVQCQCNTQYYVYCQEAGLSNDVIRDTLSRVSPSAKLLDLSSNQISRINPRLFSNLPDLQSLNIAENRLTQLASNLFQNLTKLREFNLNKNRIQTLDETTFTGLKSLTSLDLSGNSVSNISSGTFSKLSSLDRLQLERNSIQELKPKTFSGLKKLTSLDLSKNSLKNLQDFTFSGAYSLKTLNLAGNQLSESSRTSFSGLTQLTSLVLNHNDLTDIDFLYDNDFHLSLTDLDLSHNCIGKVPDSAVSYNRHLNVVDLSNNRINLVANSAFKSLSLDSLNLSHNSLPQIDRFMFKDVRQIIHLDLSNNRITDIKTGAFDSFRERLFVVDLHHNSLPTVHTGMFRGMTRLRSLDLSDNKISTIDDDSFADMAVLESLDLSNNKIVTISFSAVRGPSNLRHFCLIGNPIKSMIGFSFEGSETDVLVEVNSSVDSLSRDTATISWPYKAGSQLYWTVSVTCVMTSSQGTQSQHSSVNPSAATASCTPPPYSNSLKPFNQHLTLTGLKSGGDYFVCVNPVFLSPHTKMTQCTVLHIERPQGDADTTRQGRDLSSDNNGTTSIDVFSVNSWIALLLCHSIMYMLYTNFL